MAIDLVSGVKTAWDLAKGVKAATDALDDAVIKNEMANLLSALADAKMQAVESQEKIAELEAKLKLSEEMKFDGFAYFQYEGENKSGPLCQVCFDRDKLVVRLQDSPIKSKGTHTCLSCNNYFGRRAPITWSQP